MSSLPSITWLETVKSYLDKRLMWVFMLGCSSGFPWVLIGSNMSGWLKDAGLTLSAIGYFGSVFAVYAINFLWAPLVDRVKLPVLYRLLGQRRSWIFFCQSIVLVATVFIAGVNPAENLVFASLLPCVLQPHQPHKTLRLMLFVLILSQNQKNLSCHKLLQWQLLAGGQVIHYQVI